VVLLTAVIAGLFVGVLRARWNRDKWQPPVLRHAWLVLVAFLPQLFAFYLPFTRSHVSNSLAATCLVSSQIGLLLFCWLNRRSVGIPLLAAGLGLNLLAISANGGLMPIGIDTAARFLPADVLQKLQLGSRLSSSSKDVLLPTAAVVFPWFADRFVSPAWFQYRFVFSLGDIFVSLGAFWLLGSRSLSIKVSQERESPHVNQPID
jgi:protein-S-isoprenylcysteine O-methyltransferase Ste14